VAFFVGDSSYGVAILGGRGAIHCILILRLRAFLWIPDKVSWDVGRFALFRVSPPDRVLMIIGSLLWG
jgi:hypothetical protein